MNQGYFFNFDLRRPVNSMLIGALIIVICVWLLVYYFHKQTNIIEAHISGAEELATLLKGN